MDDERLGLERFKTESRGLDDIEMIGEFRNPLDALAFAEKTRVDLAFLDIVMPQMNGLDLSDRLRGLYPDIIIIFISAYDDYMPEAFRKRGADYFIVKPYERAELEAVVRRAKLLSRRFAKHIYIETFGRFNVYLDEKPIRFTSETAKELLALMVDRRGTSLSNQEAFNCMWPSRSYDNASAVSLYKALRKLKDTLGKYGIEDLVVQVSSREYRVNAEKFDCDYYQLLSGDPTARRKYAGRYMSNWSWGEETIAELNGAANPPV